MPTILSVKNMALIQMKASPLADVSETNEASLVLDTLWDEVLKEMLEAGFWKFAMRTVEITEDNDVSPAFGMAYAFNMPDDWVRTYLVSLSETMDPPLDPYEEEANLLFADATPLYLRYVSNADPDFGGDLDRWTARFTKAMAFKLATRAAPKAMGASDSALERLRKDEEMAVLEALGFEAQREPAKRPPAGRWVSQRFRYPFRDYRRA